MPGKATPGELSLVWDGHSGLLTNSHRQLLRDDVEGDSDYDTAVVVALGERGEPNGAWRSALDAPSSRLLARKGVPKDDYVSVRAVALPGPTLLRAMQSYTGTASHYCVGGAWIVGTTALTDIGLGGCAVEPLLSASGRGERAAVFAFGRDYDAYTTYMNRLNEGGSPSVSPPPPASVLMLRSATSPWRRVKVQNARARGAIGIGPTALAIAAREPAANGKASTLAVVLVPWESGLERRIEIDSGTVGEPTVAFVGSDAVVVYAKRDTEQGAYTLRSATISAAGTLTVGPRLGPEGAVAPALVVAGHTMALAFTEESKPSRVRFACGATDVATLAGAAEIVSAPDVRARDPELTFAPDGSGGVIAFHAFTAKTSSVRTSAFSCVD